MVADRLPIRYIHGNILVGHGTDRCAFYRVNPISYPFYRDKQAWRKRIKAFAYDVEANFSIWRVNRMYRAAEYVRQGVALLDNRYDTGRVWRQYLEGHRDVLERRQTYSPEFYLAVTLETDHTDTFSAGLGRDLGRAQRSLESLIGLNDARGISQREIAALADAEEAAYDRARARLPVRRATVREIQWLFRRAALRGVQEPDLDDYWEPNALVIEAADGNDVTYEPLGTDLMQLGEEPIREKGGVLEIDAGEHGHYFQAFLAMGALPDDVEFPGESEFLFTPLEAASFPVDMVMHVEWEGNRAAVARVRRKVRDADTALSEQESSSAGSLSWLPEEDTIQGRRLEKRLQKSDQPPLLRVSVSFAVGARSKKDLVKRVGELRSRFGTIKLRLPSGSQENLFLDHLPRADGGVVRNYRDWLTVTQFSALMPIATHSLGSLNGAYFARIQNGSERPVFVDITEAPRKSRASTYLLAGAPGSGKTTAAEKLIAEAIMRGGQGVDVDPKNDHHLEDLPELKGRYGIIDLDDPDEYEGLLDPLVILPEGRRVDGATSYLLGLLGDVPERWPTKVRQAVQQVVEENKQPCCKAVIERLTRKGAEDDARTVGEALATWANGGLAKFAFSNGLAKPLERHQLDIIRPSALVLPEPTIARADFEEEERVSVGTLRLIAYYAMGMINGDRTLHKTLLFDEAHFFLDTPSGRRLISDVNRQGRAKYVTMLLASQHVKDPGEVAKLIGTILIFGMETAEEARDALELLGQDRDDDELVESITSARKGRCYIKDIHGYVAHAQVDVVYQHWLRLLDTTPGARRERATV